jgi:hypothetical protein
VVVLVAFLRVLNLALRPFGRALLYETCTLTVCGMDYGRTIRGARVCTSDSAGVNRSWRVVDSRPGCLDLGRWVWRRRV